MTIDKVLEVVREYTLDIRRSPQETLEGLEQLQEELEAITESVRVDVQLFGLD